MSNRKTVYTIMCILLLAGLFPVKLYAQADYQVTEMSAQGMVSSETLNVRSGPGTGYKVIGIVAVGETVSITGQCDNNWYRIDYNGQEGYVSGKYIELTEKGAETEGTGTEGAETEEKEKEEKEEEDEKISLLDFEWIKPVVILIIMAVVAVSILLTLRSIRKSDEDEEELYEEEDVPEDDIEYGEEETEELEEAEAYEPVKRQKTQMSQPRKNKKRRQEQQKQTVVLKEEDFLVHIDPVYFEEENKIEQPESIQEDKEEVKPEDIKKAMEKLEKLQEEIERLKQNQGK